MEYKIVGMSLSRYDELTNFWKNCEGIYLSDDDEYKNLSIFLKRNPGLNFVALYENKIIATIKCSHDGRRGYLHHLAVENEHRRRGVAKDLVEKCLKELSTRGINKYRVFVLDSNMEAINFWEHIGFEEQVYDYRTLQKDNASCHSEHSEEYRSGERQ